MGDRNMFDEFDGLKEKIDRLDEKLFSEENLIARFDPNGNVLVSKDIGKSWEVFLKQKPKTNEEVEKEILDRYYKHNLKLRNAFNKIIFFSGYEIFKKDAKTLNKIKKSINITVNQNIKSYLDLTHKSEKSFKEWDIDFTVNKIISYFTKKSEILPITTMAKYITIKITEKPNELIGFLFDLNGKLKISDSVMDLIFYYMYQKLSKSNIHLNEISISLDENLNKCLRFKLLFTNKDKKISDEAK